MELKQNLLLFLVKNEIRKTEQFYYYRKEVFFSHFIFTFL